MEKYNFFDVFQENSDGSLTPKVSINVNGINFGPGTRFTRGVAFGGIDFHQYKDYNIVAEYIGEVLFIRGFSRKDGQN